MEILKKHHNALLSRTELQVDLPFEKATPSVADVRKMIASHMKSAEDVIVIDRIATIFGHRKALVSASIYDSKESLDKIAKKPKKKKEAATPTPAK